MNIQKILKYINQDLNEKFEKQNAVIRLLILVVPFFVFMHFGLIIPATTWIFSLFIWRTRYQNQQNIKFWEDHVVVPKKAPRELLSSMAMRYDHSFGMGCNLTDNEILEERKNGNIFANQYMTSRERESLITTMSQLHEEVVGTGFYKYKK